MSVIDSPIDDTVQLDEMAVESDDSNFLNFPPASDDVRIIPGNENEEEIVREKTGVRAKRVPKRSVLTIAVLTGINLMNYMDRFTIAGKCGEREGGIWELHVHRSL